MVTCCVAHGQWLRKNNNGETYADVVRAAMDAITQSTILYYIGFLCDDTISFEEFVSIPIGRKAERQYHSVVTAFVEGNGTADRVWREMYPHKSLGMASTFQYLCNFLSLDLSNVNYLTVCRLPFQHKRMYTAVIENFYSHWMMPQLRRKCCILCSILDLCCVFVIYM